MHLHQCLLAPNRRSTRTIFLCDPVVLGIVDLLSYESKPTDKQEQNDTMDEQNLDGMTYSFQWILLGEDLVISSTREVGIACLIPGGTNCKKAS